MTCHGIKGQQLVGGCTSDASREVLAWCTVEATVVAAPVHTARAALLQPVQGSGWGGLNRDVRSFADACQG